MSSRNEKTIVVLDDDESMAMMAQDILKHAGYSYVIASSNNKEFFSVIDSVDCDLLLIDYRLEKGVGTDLIARLKMREGRRSPVFILMTGEVDSLDKLRLNKNLATILEKPFTPEELVEVVDQALCLSRKKEDTPRETVVKVSPRRREDRESVAPARSNEVEPNVSLRLSEEAAKLISKKDGDELKLRPFGKDFVTNAMPLTSIRAILARNGMQILPNGTIVERKQKSSGGSVLRHLFGAA